MYHRKGLAARSEDKIKREDRQVQMLHIIVPERPRIFVRTVLYKHVR